MSMVIQELFLHLKKAYLPEGQLHVAEYVVESIHVDPAPGHGSWTIIISSKYEKQN